MPGGLPGGGGMLKFPFDRYITCCNLPVSRMVHQISRIKASLDIFSTKEEKSSKFYLQLKKKILLFLVKDSCIVGKFYSISVYVRPF